MKRIHQLVSVIALLFVAGVAAAQSFPTKPIRVIVPYPPGGVDVLARVVLTEMSNYRPAGDS